MKYLHILNPSQSQRKSVQKFFSMNPSEAHVWVERKQHPTHVETIVEWALEEGMKAIAVWGGDGTFNRVIQSLAAAQALGRVKVALVAVGTANDFARAMDLGSWRDVILEIFNGKAALRQVDLGLMEAGAQKRIFVNNAGFGRTQEALRRKRAHLIKDILGFREARLQLEWENNGVRKFETCRAILGMVCNAPFFSKGLHFKRAVDPADGVLNAFFVPLRGRLHLFVRLLKARLGSPLADKDTVCVNMDRLSVESDIDLYPQVDGEAVLENGIRSLKFSLLKGALRLAVPNGI